MKVFVANVRIDKHAYRPTDDNNHKTTWLSNDQYGRVYRNIRNHVTYKVRGGYRADRTPINV